MRQKPDIEKLREDTEQISSKTVKALGIALLDFYLKLEKIPADTILKADSYDLFSKIDDIVAMWRDEPWKNMTSFLQKLEWLRSANALVNPLTKILAALPDQINDSDENDKYTYMALKSYCLACEEIRTNSSISSNPFIKKILSEILSLIDDVNSALDRKGINLDWIDPSQDEEPLELSAETGNIQEVEVLETVIEEIAQEESILARLYRIGQLIHEKIELHQNKNEKTELQDQSVEFLKKLSRIQNPQALYTLAQDVFNHRDLSNIDKIDTKRFKIRTGDIENIIGKYNSANNLIFADNDSGSQDISEQNLDEMPFEALADLHTRIQTTIEFIQINLRELSQPDDLSTVDILDEPPESANDDLGWWGIVPCSTYMWGSKKPTKEEIALLKQNQVLQQEIRTLKEQKHGGELALYHAKFEMLESERAALNLAAGAINQVLQNTEEQYKMILRQLIEQLKDIKPVLVPIAEQPEPSPENLKRTHKTLKLLLKLIKFVLSPIVITGQIILYLKRKFSHSHEEFSEYDNAKYYEDTKKPKSTHEDLMTSCFVGSDPREDAEEGQSEAVEEDNHKSDKRVKPDPAPPVVVEDSDLHTPMASTTAG